MKTSCLLAVLLLFNQAGTTMPEPRWASGAAVLAGAVYIAGGYNPGLGGHLTAFETFSMVSNIFKSRAPMPDVQTGAAAAFINADLYLAGGSDAHVNTPRLMSYSVILNTWSKLAAPSSAHGNGPAGGAIGGRFYVAGGRSLDGSSLVSVLESYDPKTNMWTRHAPMPTARHAVGSAVLGGKLYVIGGSTNAGIVGTIESYDPATNAWSTMARLNTPRSEIAVGVLDGVIYAAGGRTASGPVSTVEAYDAATNTWRAMPPMSTARSAAAGAALNGVLYVIGGYGPGEVGLATVERIRR